MKRLMIASAMLALNACAPIQVASPDRDASVKEFAPAEGKAQVYVCRDETLHGAGQRPDIELDNRFITNIARSTFVYQEVEPGTHVVKTKTPLHDSVIDFKVAVGDQRFFQTWISFGGVAIIDEMTVEAGKRCVKSGSLLDQLAKMNAIVENK